MAKQQNQYRAYMLRLWQVRSDGGIAWRASLEDPHTGKRKGFVDLESLLAFLKEPLTDDTASSTAPSREKVDDG
jgi:hypothetical protein